MFPWERFGVTRLVVIALKAVLLAGCNGAGLYSIGFGLHGEING